MSLRGVVRRRLWLTLPVLAALYVLLVLGASRWLDTLRVDLTHDRLYTLSPGTRDILGRAIQARGTTFDSYHDAFGETGQYQHQLQVFTHAGEPCPRCGTEISKSRVAGRGTYTCPTCQK